LEINPTIKQPGFELKINTWVTLNRIRTGHGRSGHTNGGLSDTESCYCGYESQTIKHITTECLIRAFKATMEDIHLVKEEAVEWMKNLNLELLHDPNIDCIPGKELLNY